MIRARLRTLRLTATTLLTGAVLAAAPGHALAASTGLTHRAVDISQFNGCSVNYPAVRRAGYDTLIFRVAAIDNRGLFTDRCFNSTQVSRARRANLRLGGYIYSIPRQNASAMRDASYLWRAGKRAGLFKAGDLKPINDEEQSDYGEAVNTRWARAFAYYFRSQGSVIYTTCCIIPWLPSYINVPLWVANTSGSPVLPPFARTYQLWQYNFTGRVPGIPGDVDLSRSQPGGSLHIYLR